MTSPAHTCRARLVHERLATLQEPEALLSGVAASVEPHVEARGVELQVEGDRPDRLLLVTRESGEAVGEGVGDAEFGHETTVAQHSCSVAAW